jgi:hypothetical protein
MLVLAASGEICQCATTYDIRLARLRTMLGRAGPSVGMVPPGDTPYAVVGVEAKEEVKPRRHDIAWWPIRIAGQEV